MPEVEAAAAAPPKKLFRSDPDLPPAVNGVADVLQDGVEALLKIVDTKVNWVMPDNWVWIPGSYEWHEETEEGKSPMIMTNYKLTLKDDNTCEYTWQRVEQTKKKTEHFMSMVGIWKQPAKMKISVPSEEGSDSAVEEQVSAEPAEGEEGEAAVGSRPGTAEPEQKTRTIQIDALVIVPKSLGFKRCTTGSTGKTVTISTKSKEVDKLGAACLKVASAEEWAALQSSEEEDPAAEPVIAPFELVFEVKETGELVRSDTLKAKDVFPPGPTAIALAGITSKAVARLGEPHVIITDAWMPDAEKPLPNQQSMPFSPLHWLATYLKTHSPSYEKHCARQAECKAFLTGFAQSAKQAEIEAELAVIAAALAARQADAKNWLLEKAKYALDVQRREEEEDAEDEDD